VQIDVHGPLAYRAQEATEPDAVMHIGEPSGRGGTGEGASPLAHFLAGVGSCLLNQFVRVAVAEGHELEFEGAAVRGEFGREAGGGFERIGCRINARGQVARAVAESLLERAEALCYVHVTLRKAVRMTTTLWLDGQEVAASVTGPEPT
jgi:uncharacterized OsmC-like protein